MTDRYARHLLIPGWKPDALANARVAIFGVGALGNEAARLLGMAGVGELLLCDPDVVSYSNLSRCPLFRPADVGDLKVAAARARLAELAPDTVVIPRAAPLDAGIGLADLRDSTLVVGCLDSVAARVLLAQRCGLVGVGWLDGGTHPWGGEVRLFRPGGACYGCLAGPSGRAVVDDPHHCGSLGPPQEQGACAPVAALVGGWLAATAIRVICGLPAGPEIISLDVESAGYQAGSSQRDPSCPLHVAIAAELVRVTTATSTAAVADVLALISPDEDVMTWRGFAPWVGADGTPVVPRHRARLAFQRTATFLRRAAPDALLCDVGVPPREILPVVSRTTAQVTSYLEFAAEEPSWERSR